LALPCGGRDHSLSAAAELHRAGFRARHVEGAGREERRQGAGAGAGGFRLRPVRGRGLKDVPMNLVLAKTDTQRAADTTFTAARGRLPGAGAVADARAKAFDAYQRTGLPHRRIEEWKYTDLRALVRDVLPLAAGPDAAALARAKTALAQHGAEAAAKLVMVDGAFAPELSDLAALGDGVSAKTLR